MNEERLKELASGTWSADDRAPGFDDICGLASALLAAQKRVAELEEENKTLGNYLDFDRDRITDLLKELHEAKEKIRHLETVDGR